MFSVLTSLKRTLRGGGLALAAAALVVTSGCQSMRAEEDTTIAVDAPPEAEAPPPVVDVADAPVIQNRAALLLPLTGPRARVGRSLANAANMALQDLGGGNIKLQTYDTAVNGPERAAERAVADGARIFLGPLLAENVRAISGYARSRNIPIISFSNDATIAGNGVYVMGFQPSQSIQRVVAFARGRGIERFAALVPNGTYGNRASDAFLSSVRGAGGRVTGIETYERQRSKLPASVRRLTDYEARTARAAQGGTVRADGTVAPVEERLAPVSFQSLLIADSGTIASEFLQSLQRYGAGADRVRYLGTELWNAEDRLRSARGLHGSWFASVPDAQFDKFAARYRQKFGGAPSRLSSMAYDAVLIANGQAEQWPVGGDFPARTLTDPDGFAGMDGIFRFGSNGVAQRGLEVQEVTGSGTKIVSPAPRVFQTPRVSMLVN
ncbi:penicillin-binding protein activator [Pacificimonas sp. ICDLI1SI03]